MVKTRAEQYEERLTLRGTEPAFDEQGVDLTQIRRALALTPLERLALADRAAREIAALRRIARMKVRPGGE